MDARAALDERPAFEIKRRPNGYAEVDKLLKHVSSVKEERSEDLRNCSGRPPFAGLPGFAGANDGR
jgi:hypothetical protein